MKHNIHNDSKELLNLDKFSEDNKIIVLILGDNSPSVLMESELTNLYDTDKLTDYNIFILDYLNNEDISSVNRFFPFKIDCVPFTIIKNNKVNECIRGYVDFKNKL